MNAVPSSVRPTRRVEAVGDLRSGRQDRVERAIASRETNPSRHADASTARGQARQALVHGRRARGGCERREHPDLEVDLEDGVRPPDVDVLRTTKNSTASVSASPTSASTSVMPQRMRPLVRGPAPLAASDQQADGRRAPTTTAGTPCPSTASDEGERRSRRGARADPEVVSPRRPHQHRPAARASARAGPNGVRTSAQAAHDGVRGRSRAEGRRARPAMTKRKSPWIVR